jgi:hypothetical protein
MGEERPAGDGVQDLRPRRAHAGTFASREHNRKAGALNRQSNLLCGASAAGAVISECVAAEKCNARNLSRQNDQIRAFESTRQAGASGRQLSGERTHAILRTLMEPALFLPTARQLNWLLLIALLSLGEALYLRYLAIEYAPVSLACQAGLDTWLCATFRLVIVLFNHSAFGWVALAAAVPNLLRPSILLVGVALAAIPFGLVLHNADLAGLAAALLLLTLARPAPAAE